MGKKEKDNEQGVKRQSGNKRWRMGVEGLHRKHTDDPFFDVVREQHLPHTLIRVLCLSHTHTLSLYTVDWSGMERSLDNPFSFDQADACCRRHRAIQLCNSCATSLGPRSLCL